MRLRLPLTCLLLLLALPAGADARPVGDEPVATAAASCAKVTRYNGLVGWTSIKAVGVSCRTARRLLPASIKGSDSDGRWTHGGWRWSFVPTGPVTGTYKGRRGDARIRSSYYST